MNSYLDKMSEILLAHGATLDKFEGDGIMAFFGDPTSRGEKEDAVRCAQMALEMQARAIEMGIDSGICTVGNFGSENQMVYTIRGRALNTASRLEAAAEPGRILVSQNVVDRIGERIPCTPKGEIRLRGIDRALSTYWIPAS